MCPNGNEGARRSGAELLVSYMPNSTSYYSNSGKKVKVVWSLALALQTVAFKKKPIEAIHSQDRERKPTLQILYKE